MALAEPFRFLAEPLPEQQDLRRKTHQFTDTQKETQRGGGSFQNCRKLHVQVEILDRRLFQADQSQRRAQVRHRSHSPEIGHHILSNGLCR